MASRARSIDLDSVVQISRRPDFPFPCADMSHALCDAEDNCGVVVRVGRVDMELGEVGVGPERTHASPVDPGRRDHDTDADLEIGFWISDTEEGVANVASDV